VIAALILAVISSRTAAVRRDHVGERLPAKLLQQVGGLDAVHRRRLNNSSAAAIITGVPSCH
jgi:hypothetical protein